MEKILLTNLERQQAFDAALQRGAAIERLAARYVAAVLFEQRTRQRSAAIADLQKQLLDLAERQVIPAARTLGTQAARSVLAKLQGAPAQLLTDAVIRRVLTQDKLRVADRMKILQRLIDDKSNTLDNRLAAYWLEPGADAKSKLQTLRAMYTEQEARRKAYDESMARYREGKETKRPGKPPLDFYSKFTNEVKGDFREQARRAGTDAETAEFVRKGESSFAWVTVNAGDACPDCRKRQGVTGGLEFWDGLGRPGSGRTVCGAACFCMLVPDRTLTQDPRLSAGLNSRVEGVRTTDADAKKLDANRPGLGEAKAAATAKPAAVVGTPSTPPPLTAALKPPATLRRASGDEPSESRHRRPEPPTSWRPTPRFDVSDYVTQPVQRSPEVDGLLPHLRDAMLAAAEVHASPLVHAVPLSVVGAEDRLGMVTFRRDLQGRMVVTEFALNPGGPWPALTSLHEHSHVIDVYHFGGRVAEASLVSPDLARLRGLLEATPEHARLLEMLADAHRLKASALSQIQYDLQDAAMGRLANRLSTNEMVSRAYTQWVAGQSKTPSVVRQYRNALLRLRAGGTWPYNSGQFKGISRELETLFGDTGLR